MTFREPFAGLRVWEFDIDVPDDDLASCARLLSGEERERAARYLVPRARARFTVGRARLRSILGETLGVPPDAVAFAYGPHGKPSLRSPWDATGIHFSLSHSGSRALLALTVGYDVGCDLEARRELRHGRAVARRFFSEGENRELSPFEGEAWAAAFFRIWTLKEAFVKALGSGLTFPTRSFTVTIGAGEPSRLAGVDGDPDAPARWHLDTIDAAAGFAAAVCVARTRRDAVPSGTPGVGPSEESG